MKLDQGEVVDGLVQELLTTVYKYEGTLYMATVVGCLEFVKQQVINGSPDKDDE
jgi:hypothetical protein